MAAVSVHMEVDASSKPAPAPAPQAAAPQPCPNMRPDQILAAAKERLARGLDPRDDLGVPADAARHCLARTVLAYCAGKGIIVKQVENSIGRDGDTRK